MRKPPGSLKRVTHFREQAADRAYALLEILATRAMDGECRDADVKAAELIFDRAGFIAPKRAADMGKFSPAGSTTEAMSEAIAALGGILKALREKGETQGLTADEQQMLLDVVDRMQRVEEARAKILLAARDLDSDTRTALRDAYVGRPAQLPAVVLEKEPDEVVLPQDPGVDGQDDRGSGE